jgi:hypothetical protein
LTFQKRGIKSTKFNLNTASYLIILSGYVAKVRRSLAKPVSINGKFGIIDANCIEINSMSFLLLSAIYYIKKLLFKF